MFEDKSAYIYIYIYINSRLTSSSCIHQISNSNILTCPQALSYPQVKYTVVFDACLDNNHILDNHFPTRNVIAMLARVDFVENLIQFQCCSITSLSSFDPWSQSASAALPLTIIKQKAREIHSKCTVRFIKLI